MLCDTVCILGSVCLELVPDHLTQCKISPNTPFSPHTSHWSCCCNLHDYSSICFIILYFWCYTDTVTSLSTIVLVFVTFLVVMHGSNFSLPVLIFQCSITAHFRTDAIQLVFLLIFKLYLRHCSELRGFICMQNYHWFASVMHRAVSRKSKCSKYFDKVFLIWFDYGLRNRSFEWVEYQLSAYH